MTARRSSASGAGRWPLRVPARRAPSRAIAVPSSRPWSASRRPTTVGAADTAPAVPVHADPAEPLRDQIEHHVVVGVVDHAEVRDGEGLVAQVEGPGRRRRRDEVGVVRSTKVRSQASTGRAPASRISEPLAADSSSGAGSSASPARRKRSSWLRVAIPMSKQRPDQHGTART